MTNKAMKYGIVIIAIMLLVVMVFAGAASAAKVTVSFDPNGGSGSMSDQKVTLGKETALKQNNFSAPLGKSFQGWNTENDGSGTGYLDKAKINITVDTTLYAMWDTVDITYCANGGSGTMDVQTIGKGVPTKLSSNCYEKTGCLCLKWNTLDDGSGTSYGLHDSVTLAGNTQLYAIWISEPGWLSTGISDQDQLVEFASLVNQGVEFVGKTVTLLNDIEITGDDWTPIGSYISSNPFIGNFDGNNYIISGQLKNDSVTKDFGIFGAIANATIKNIVIKDLNVSVSADTSYVGALVGRTEQDGSGAPSFSEPDVSTFHSHISNVKLYNVSVSGLSMVGGVVGRIGTNSSILIEGVFVDENCKMSCGDRGVGAVVGQLYSGSVVIVDSKTYAKNVTADVRNAGGIVGSGNLASMKLQDCDVEGTAISGGYNVGGILGTFNDVYYMNFSSCKVADCTIAFAETSSVCGGGGLVGYIYKKSIEAPVIYLDDVMENVTVKPGGVWDIGCAGLVEATLPSKLTDLQLNITLSSATDSIAPLKEIVIGNNVTIRNSSVCPYDSTTIKNEISQTDYQHVLDKITSVSVGDKIKSIDANAFNGAFNLKRITDIDALTSIGAYAFKGSNLTGGFYIPITATVDTYAFNGTDNLQIIYGSATEGLADLNESTALVNITDIGTLSAIQPGSFSVSSGNKFETVTLGSNTANKFKNLSDGTYLTANGPWTPGYSYLAEYEYVPPQYTPSSSKQTGYTVILQEGQTAPTAYATATPTVSPTAAPTEKPVTPTVIATANPTAQSTTTSKSPAPFVGLLAGLGAAAVLLRLRK